jgi:proteic killer suppression protein
MIKRFRSRALKRFYERGEDRRIRADHRATVRDVLARLDASSEPEDMNLPGFHLHPLKGDYAGYWAVTVRANWRVIFRFEKGDATDVDYLDYH